MIFKIILHSEFTELYINTSTRDFPSLLLTDFHCLNKTKRNSNDFLSKPSDYLFFKVEIL